MILYTTVLFLVIFLAFYFFSAKNGELKSWDFSIGYTVKVLAGMFFLMIYSNHYGNGTLSADAGKFLDESRILRNVFFHSPSDYFKLLFGLDNSKELILKYLQETHHWDANSQLLINDNRNILRLHSLIQFISFGYVYIHLLFFSIISFFGSYHFYKGVKEWVAIPKRLLFWGLLLIPSVLFWSSSILKEPLMLLGFGLLVNGILGENSVKKRWSLIVPGIFLLIMFKPYVILSAIPALLFFVLTKLFKRKQLLLSSITFIIFIAVGLLLFGGLRTKVIETLSRKQYDFINVSKGGIHLRGDTCFYYVKPELMSNVELHVEDEYAIVHKPTKVDILISKDLSMPQQTILQPSDRIYTVPFYQDKCSSYIEVTRINNSFTNLLKNIPEALVNSLFRPFFGDPGSNLKFFAIIQTLLLNLFLIFAIIKRRQLDVTTRNIVLSLLIFAVTLATVIGWVTPVLGAISRYKIPIDLVLVAIGFILLPWPLSFGLKHNKRQEPH